MLTTNLKDQEIPDLYLEQYVLNEAPQAMREAIEASAEALERIAKLKIQNAEFLNRYPPRVMAQAIQARKAKKPAQSLRFKLIMALSTGLPAILALFFFSSILFNSNNPGDNSDLRTKGMEQALIVYLKGSSGYQEIKSGALVKAYDSIQLAYRPGTNRFGILFSLDGNFRLTLHYPESYNAKPELANAAQTLLPYAYQLDDAPSFERFYFISAAEDFSVIKIWQDLENQANSLRTANSASKDLRFPSNFRVSTFDVRKSGDRQ